MGNVYGDDFANTLHGTTGDDIIQGRGGDDTIYGNGAFGSSPDLLDGGAGNDTIYAYGRASANGGADSDRIYGDNISYQFIQGGDGIDYIYGNGGVDYLYGDLGDDTIDTGADLGGGTASGGEGNDQFYSTHGITSLDGGNGDDVFHVTQGLANGSESFGGGEGDDIIIAASSNQNIGIDYISGIEEITGAGNSNVTIQTTNTTGTHYLDLSGITLTDIALIEGQRGNDYIYTKGGYIVGDLSLARDDIIAGGDGNDQLSSGFGSDTLRGDAGNDTLVGGVGGDMLTGGLGADKFRFDTVTDTVVGDGDLVTDFNAAQGDNIDIAYIDADTIITGSQAFTFVGTDAFSGAAGEVRYDDVGGYTHIYGDVNSDMVADFEVVLQGSHALMSANFFL